MWCWPTCSVSFRRPTRDRMLLAWRRIDWATDPFACGGYTFMRPGGTGARGRLAAADTGALFWAGAATATPTIADTVQAAYLSGLRAAAEVRAFLGAEQMSFHNSGEMEGHDDYGEKL